MTDPNSAPQQKGFPWVRAVGGLAVVVFAANHFGLVHFGQDNNAETSTSVIGGADSTADPTESATSKATSEPDPSDKPTTRTTLKPQAPKTSAAPKKVTQNPADYGKTFDLTIQTTGKAALAATGDLEHIGCKVTPSDHFTSASWNVVAIFQHNTGVSAGVPAITDLQKFPAYTIGPKTRTAIDKAIAANSSDCGLSTNTGWKNTPGCGTMVGPTLANGLICPDGKVVNPDESLSAGCPGSAHPLLSDGAKKTYYCKAALGRPAGEYKNKKLVSIK